MLDLKEIKRRSGGELAVQVGENELVFRFRKPTQRAWLEILPSMTAIDGIMRDWALGVARATSSGEKVPKLSIGWEDVQPIRDFVTDHLRGVDGMSYGGEPITWEELEAEDQAQVMELLDFEHLIKLAAAIHESARLQSDAKKK